MDVRTVRAYDEGAERYLAVHRTVDPPGDLGAGDGVVLDLGCGSGPHLAALGPAAVGVDPSAALCRYAVREAPGRVVRAEAAALPLRRASVAAVWSAKALQHLPAGELPLALAEVHRVLPVGARFEAVLSAGCGRERSDDAGGVPDRLFTAWDVGGLADVVHGAGFAPADVTEAASRGLHVSARRARTLPDIVGPGMRLLLCGLNPSPYAADAGVGFARPGNRAWPALLAAGLASVDRDPRHLLAHHGIGMTDLVKRATAGAAELTPAEYAEGVARLERLCARLRPRAVCLLGLAGWRAAVDRRAGAGWQARRLAGVPVYVMPNPSRLNAHVRVDDLVAHLRAAITPPR